MSNDQTVSCGGDNLFGDDLRLIDLENALDLGQESGQQPEVSAAHSDQSGDDVWSEHSVGKSHASRQPPFVQKSRHLNRHIVVSMAKIGCHSPKLGVTEQNWVSLAKIGCHPTHVATVSESLCREKWSTDRLAGKIVDRN